MFKIAVKEALNFTRPLATGFYYFDKKIINGLSTLVVLNDEGDKSIFRELKPFAIVNNYVEDHPLIGEKMIYRNYYVIDSCKKNYDLNKLEEVLFVNLKELIQNNMYDNPRNRERTEEILEVISFL